MGPEGAAHKHLYISPSFSLAVLLLVQLIVASSPQVLILVKALLSRKKKKRCAFFELSPQPLQCSYLTDPPPAIGLSLLTSSPFSCLFSGSCYPLILCPVLKSSSTALSFVSISTLEVEVYISVHLYTRFRQSSSLCSVTAKGRGQQEYREIVPLFFLLLLA